MSKNMRKSQIPDYTENRFELIFNKLKDSAGMIHINQDEVIIEEDEDEDREPDDDDENEEDNDDSDME
jgi:hypothetical protein